MRLAIFDLDNTLIDRASLFRRWAAEFLAERGLHPAATEIGWLVTADGDGFNPRVGFVEALRQRYALTEPAADLLPALRRRIVDLIEPDPRASTALDRLRSAGWRVAIATNGTTDQQWAKIRRAGLEAHVDAVAVSEEVGAAKPDRRVFAAAAERCGIPLAGVDGWMVGDCATRDIGGGQAAGLRTIWMRRGRRWTEPSSASPDATVDHVDDAAAHILHHGYPAR